MSGIVQGYKQGCSIVVTSTSTASATVTGTQHVMTTFNSQIRVGQKIQGTTSTVSAVQEDLTTGVRKTKITTSSSITISSGETVTFESSDKKFTNTGRVGQVSVFYITVERLEGRVLSPTPSISLNGVYSMSDYKVSFADTLNGTLLTKRVYTITHTVPLKKQSTSDEIHIKGLTIVSTEASSAKIYGFELLVKPPGESIESITNSKASSFKNLGSFSFPSSRFINKKAEKRLLVVYGDPNSTFKLGVLSNVIPISAQGNAQTNVTTLSMGNGTSATVAKINKGMTITATASSSVSGGIKVVSTSGTDVVVSTAQSLAANESISFGHVLIAANTVKTIDSNGIYYTYLEFPKNNSTANLTFTITLTENVTETFIDFATPSTVEVISLSSQEVVNQNLVTKDTRTKASEQVASTSNTAISGTTVLNQSLQTDDSGSGGA
tara:strand:- start:678 stop:1991 length:1314 start_codon:yes stop_codon:yes gene_type:complete